MCLIFVISNATPCVFAQKGSVIVIQTKGVVEAYSPQGRKLTAPVVRGSVLPVGYSIKTGLFAESTLLLSNGTTATLQENSKLRLDKFEQSPFDAKAGSFSQLQAEPSTSQVSIDMEIGSLVVQTKKLNKASSFSISTPVGTAGIRGTQFQMAMSPNTGMKLDVAESQVAFTPAGQTQPVVVGPGKGLDASSSGVVKQRPISPSAAQNINVKNSAANSVCGTVPVATAKQANAKATSSSSNDGSEEGSGSQAILIMKIVPRKRAAKVMLLNPSLNKPLIPNRQVPGQQTSSVYLEKVLGILTPQQTSDEVDIPAAPPGFTPPTLPVSGFQLSMDSNKPENDGLTLDFQPLDFFNSPLGIPTELSEETTSEQLTELLKGYVQEEDQLYSASLALETFLKHPPYNYDDNVNESFPSGMVLNFLIFP